MDDVTSEDFEIFLDWIDSDRDKASKILNEYHRKLTRFFLCKGWGAGEDLADKVINRVLKKIRELAVTYKESRDRFPYFCSVANFIHQEEREKIGRMTQLPEELESPTAEDRELIFLCLDSCLEKLSAENRKLILEYHEEQGQVKIDLRKRLAHEMGITLTALRIKTHRIRASLLVCLEDCSKKMLSAETH